MDKSIGVRMRKSSSMFLLSNERCKRQLGQAMIQQGCEAQSEVLYVFFSGYGAALMLPVQSWLMLNIRGAMVVKRCIYICIIL